MAGAAVLRGEITTALRSALLEELAANGYGRLSIEAVARRAGVAKTAVYRRWNAKIDMVLEVVAEFAGRKFSLPDTGSLHGDLGLVLHILAAALEHPLASQIIPDLLVEAGRDPKIAEALQRTQRAIQDEVGVPLIKRAIERGELPADTDPDLAIDLVVGPIYWRLTVARRPLSPDDLAQLIDATAAALTAGAPGPPDRTN
ncbi:TetR/AcrR family transcriptional regulator [Asanoa iriomotensis]|uniref:TetR family transcriptional regulator n=1 Tax=Asanoa iriomotensis TaxID=234613 RepID=A0ABQ4CCC5_9ACTN|nr:TetR family transcriptional regulator [Asanoa iriomotensis]